MERPRRRTAAWTSSNVGEDREGGEKGKSPRAGFCWHPALFVILIGMKRKGARDGPKGGCLPLGLLAIVETSSTHRYLWLCSVFASTWNTSTPLERC